MIPLHELNVQILCVDKRRELWETLVNDIRGRLGCQVHPFIVGKGHILDPKKYHSIDRPAEEMGQWGYGKSGHKHIHWNALLAHKKMVQKAKDAGWPMFLMMEDDAYITPRFEKVWQAVHGSIPEFDLFYLGWWKGDENDEWNEKVEKNFAEDGIIEIDKTIQVGGLHAVIINESMYDFILALPENNPIDSQLNGIHRMVKSYFLTPKIVHILNVHSYCEGCTIQRKVL